MKFAPLIMPGVQEACPEFIVNLPGSQTVNGTQSMLLRPDFFTEKLAQNVRSGDGEGNPASGILPSLIADHNRLLQGRVLVLENADGQITTVLDPLDRTHATDFDELPPERQHDAVRVRLERSGYSAIIDGEKKSIDAERNSFLKVVIAASQRREPNDVSNVEVSALRGELADHVTSHPTAEEWVVELKNEYASFAGEVGEIGQNNPYLSQGQKGQEVVARKKNYQQDMPHGPAKNDVLPDQIADKLILPKSETTLEIVAEDGRGMPELKDNETERTVQLVRPEKQGTGIWLSGLEEKISSAKVTMNSQKSRRSIPDAHGAPVQQLQAASDNLVMANRPVAADSAAALAPPFQLDAAKEDQAIRFLQGTTGMKLPTIPTPELFAILTLSEIFSSHGSPEGIDLETEVEVRCYGSADTSNMGTLGTASKQISTIIKKTFSLGEILFREQYRWCESEGGVLDGISFKNRNFQAHSAVLTAIDNADIQAKYEIFLNELSPVTLTRLDHAKYADVQTMVNKWMEENASSRHFQTIQGYKDGNVRGSTMAFDEHPLDNMFFIGNEKGGGVVFSLASNKTYELSNNGEQRQLKIEADDSLQNDIKAGLPLMERMRIGDRRIVYLPTPTSIVSVLTNTVGKKTSPLSFVNGHIPATLNDIHLSNYKQNMDVLAKSDGEILRDQLFKGLKLVGIGLSMIIPAAPVFIPKLAGKAMWLALANTAQNFGTTIIPGMIKATTADRLEDEKEAWKDVAFDLVVESLGWVLIGAQRAAVRLQLDKKLSIFFDQLSNSRNLKPLVQNINIPTRTTIVSLNSGDILKVRINALKDKLRTDIPDLENYITNPRLNSLIAATELEKALKNRNLPSHIIGIIIANEEKVNSFSNHFVVETMINNKRVIVDVTAGQFKLNSVGVDASIIKEFDQWKTAFLDLEKVKNRYVAIKRFDNVAEANLAVNAGLLDQRDVTLWTPSNQGFISISQPKWFKHEQAAKFIETVNGLRHTAPPRLDVPGLNPILIKFDKMLLTSILATMNLPDRDINPDKLVFVGTDQRGISSTEDGVKLSSFSDNEQGQSHLSATFAQIFGNFDTAVIHAEKSAMWLPSIATDNGNRNGGKISLNTTIESHRMTAYQASDWHQVSNQTNAAMPMVFGLERTSHDVIADTQEGVLLATHLDPDTVKFVIVPKGAGDTVRSFLHTTALRYIQVIENGESNLPVSANVPPSAVELEGHQDSVRLHKITEILNRLSILLAWVNIDDRGIQAVLENSKKVVAELIAEVVEIDWNDQSSDIDGMNMEMAKCGNAFSLLFGRVGELSNESRKRRLMPVVEALHDEYVSLEHIFEDSVGIDNRSWGVSAASEKIPTFAPLSEENMYSSVDAITDPTIKNMLISGELLLFGTDTRALSEVRGRAKIVLKNFAGSDAVGRDYVMAHNYADVKKVCEQADESLSWSPVIESDLQATNSLIANRALNLLKDMWSQKDNSVIDRVTDDYRDARKKVRASSSRLTTYQENSRNTQIAIPMVIFVESEKNSRQEQGYGRDIKNSIDQNKVRLIAIRTSDMAEFQEWKSKQWNTLALSSVQTIQI